MADIIQTGELQDSLIFALACLFRFWSDIYDKV